MFSFNLVFNSLCAALKLSHLPECSRLSTSSWIHSASRVAGIRIRALMGKLKSCWSEAVFLRTACQKFHLPQSFWRPFRDQTFSWPEPSSATQLIRYTLFSLSFPPFFPLCCSLSNSHPLCHLPNYSPLTGRCFCDKINISLSELHNTEPTRLYRTRLLPSQKASLVSIVLPRFSWQKHTAKFVLFWVSCEQKKTTDNWRGKLS